MLRKSVGQEKYNANKTNHFVLTIGNEASKESVFKYRTMCRCSDMYIQHILVIVKLL